MKIKHFNVIFSLLLLCCMITLGIPSTQVRAEGKPAAGQDYYIQDEADLLTDSEETSLMEHIRKIQKKYDVDIAILTTNKRNTYSAKEYVDNFYDDGYDTQQCLNKNTSVLFIDMSDRSVTNRNYGACEEFITQARYESMKDNFTPDLSAGNYYDVCEQFLDDLNHYYGINTNPLTWIWVQILIAVGLSAIITATMVIHSKGKKETNARTYLDTQNSGLVAKRDTYINTTVRKIHHPKDTSSGSGSSGGSSSGGHSSSGGTSHF